VPARALEFTAQFPDCSFHVMFEPDELWPTEGQSSAPTMEELMSEFGTVVN
jgi:hypothetical protein